MPSSCALIWAPNSRPNKALGTVTGIYDLIDNSNGFYGIPVDNKALRSRINVTFNINGEDKELTHKFLLRASIKACLVYENSHLLVLVIAFVRVFTMV
ncbi:hypothetical protein [Psychromonas sp. SP041]|uniref:hypothetical protein n=1 Tax=Psychromonas sp. SP041 TaxID=1365007 RepID=UPI0004707C1D|nr:hypothetical protein [Psychromonas sp. SP041]